MIDFLAELPFNAVDYLVLALLLYGLIGGLVHGLSGELARAAAFLGVFVAIHYLHPHTVRLLDETTRLAPEDSPLVALALLVAAGLALLLIGRALLKGLLKFHFRGTLERLGGAVAGCIRGAALASVLVLAAGLVRSESVRRAVVERSWFGQRAHAWLPDAYGRLSERYALPPLPDALQPEPARPHKTEVEEDEFHVRLPPNPLAE